MFARILYPTDFGEYAWPNLACVLQSLPTCREVTLVHVVDVQKLQHNLLPAYVAEDEARIRALAEQTFDEWVRDLKARGIEARGAVPTGVPSTEILSVAFRELPDLVIVGKQSRSRVLERYLDATGEGVLKGAACPILVTKYHAVAERGPEVCARVCGEMFRRVLYATDWSAAAEGALQVARGFRDLGTEEVLAVHVLDRGVLPTSRPSRQRSMRGAIGNGWRTWRGGCGYTGWRSRLGSTSARPRRRSSAKRQLRGCIWW